MEPVTQKEMKFVEMALKNQVIHRHIYSYLPFDTLKRCSLVNKAWSAQVRSYLRDLRVCNATVSEVIPCFDLHVLNELVNQMTLVPFNSLTVNLGPFSHSMCKVIGSYSSEERMKYEYLLNRLNLKSLNISWDTFFGPEECPAKLFVINLFRQQKLRELQQLKFSCNPAELKEYFCRQEWAFSLPKLRLLDLGILSRWIPQRDLFTKIVEGAPNLRKLTGLMDPKLLQILPETKYFLVDSFQLRITSDREKIRCLKLAAASPELSRLIFYAPPSESGEEQFVSSFYFVLEQLLRSSQQTIEELEMNFANLPLISHLKIPVPLRKLKTLKVSTWDGVEELLNVIRTIDYPEILPVLEQVSISADIFEEEDDDGENGNAAAKVPSEFIGQIHPSLTVKKLRVEVDIGRIKIRDLGQIFPAITKLEIVPRELDVSVIPYGDLWVMWPNLEVIDVTEGIAALTRNLDAEFLGLNQEEVEFLREQDDEFLRKVHIVPVRPSVMTMKYLKLLRIQFDTGEIVGTEDQGEGSAVLKSDQVFLSRVTGFLALQRLGKAGTSVNFISVFPEAISRLGHLLPFASIIFEDFL